MELFEQCATLKQIVLLVLYHNKAPFTYHGQWSTFQSNVYDGPFSHTMFLAEVICYLEISILHGNSEFLSFTEIFVLTPLRYIKKLYALS